MKNATAEVELGPRGRGCRRRQ